MRDEQGQLMYEGEGLPVYSWFRVVLGKHRGGHRRLWNYFVESSVTAAFFFDKDDSLNKIVVERYLGISWFPL